MPIKFYASKKHSAQILNYPCAVNSANPNFSIRNSISPHLVAGILRVASWLPLSVNRALGSSIGRIAWLTNGSLRRITQKNLALCYPQFSEGERYALARNSLLHTGRTLTESAWVWLRSPDFLAKRIRIIEGEALFEEALASERGLIIAAPHIGNWEAANIVITRSKPMTYLYRTPRKTWLQPMIIRWRANFDAHPAQLNAGGLREVLNQLKNGNTVGVLPDQEPDPNGGVFAPLFGVPANSMTLLQKLATRGHAHVLFCVCHRDPGELFKRKPGWNVSFIEPKAGLLDPDPLVATTAMNKTIELCIEKNTEQYLWSYKRFSLLEQGGKRDYKSAIK